MIVGSDSRKNKSITAQVADHAIEHSAVIQWKARLHPREEAGDRSKQECCAKNQNKPLILSQLLFFLVFNFGVIHPGRVIPLQISRRSWN